MAFPAYLESDIAAFYERGGLVRLKDGSTGSITIGGTVSPAGGNFDEPVTQATLKVVGAFHGLSRARSDARRYPAIDPLISWSRYFQQLEDWYRENVSPTWIEEVETMRELLEQGDGINQMMQVTGEEGVTLEDYVTWQKASLLDMVYLQQDAFDEVDVSMPRERQQESFAFLKGLINRKYRFQDKDQARDFFTRITGLYKNLNYSRPDSPDYARYVKEITELADQHA